MLLEPWELWVLLVPVVLQWLVSVPRVPQVLLVPRVLWALLALVTRWTLPWAFPPVGAAPPTAQGTRRWRWSGGYQGWVARGCRGSWAHRELMAPRAHPQVCQYQWTEPEVPWGCQPLVGLVGQEFLELQEAGSTASPEDGKMG